jgi:hypothetical protein
MTLNDLECQANAAGPGTFLLELADHTDAGAALTWTLGGVEYSATFSGGDFARLLVVTRKGATDDRR